MPSSPVMSRGWVARREIDEQTDKQMNKESDKQEKRQ